MKRIIKAIKDWYEGDKGDPDFNFELQVHEYKRHPSRSKVDVYINKLFDLCILIFRFTKKEWKYFFTTFLTLIGVLIAVLSYIDKLKLC